MKESLLAKELLVETLQKEKSDLEGQLSMVLECDLLLLLRQ